MHGTIKAFGFLLLASWFAAVPVASAEDAAAESTDAAASETAASSAASNTLVIFDYEGSLQDWAIPDWAKESPDYVGKVLSNSQETASHGKSSMQLLADFPGSKWTGGYVEVLMHVTDWSPFSSMAVDVYLPADAPKGLEARFILTVGEKWEWTEMNRAFPLEPGKWMTITANLKPGSLDWKFFPDDKFRKDIRKVGIRVESNNKPTYSGPVYFDNLRLSQ